MIEGVWMVVREKYISKVKPFVNKDIIKVFVGVRRSGKTVLLSQIRNMLMEEGVAFENFIEMNFESMKFAEIRDAENLYKYVCERIRDIQGKVYLMLDEIQVVREWEKAINSFRVDFDCDIYITGSNSKLLSGELATFLSGRYIQIKVYPFTLSEVKEYLLQQDLFESDEKLFTDYLKYGGFPQRFVLQEESAIEAYLRDIYEAIVIRDIVERHGVKDVSVLKRVLEFLLDNIGNPFSGRNISGRLTSEGMKIATSTLLNYVDYFKEAFVLFSASRYDIKGKRILASTEKYYAVDIGLRNTIKKSELIDSSKLFENIVYLEMLSRGYEVQVGKLDEQEIDFICYRGNEKLYIQVAYLINEYDVKREFGNLEKVRDNYPKYVISGDLVDLSRNGIIHRNIIDFLLDGKE